MKTAKGQVTLVTIPEQTTYELLPSVTQIMINTDGTISTPTITCTAYKIEGSSRTILDPLEGTVKYKTSDDLTYLNYDAANGVTVNAQWSFITFFLFLTGNNNPIVRFDVPITRNGQVDTNFRVWVGTVADPNTPNLLKPWIDEQDEPQSDYMHILDYYVSPEMVYYCFINDGTESNPIYKWQEVTDATLKRWLERANNSTTGFIVTYHEGTAVNTDVLDFFLNRDYVIGDLWSNAKYTIVQNNKTEYLYNDEPLICKQSKTNGFNINDWLPISAIKTKLKNTGIDIDEYKVTITADEHWAVNNAGERVAIMNLVDGHPKITASLLEINGDVTIDGSAIIEAVGNSNEAQENLIGLLSDNDIIPTTVTHNSDGTVTVLSGNDQYVTYTKNAIDNSDFVKFNVLNGSGNSSFTLNKNGLFTADNAVIYGEIHATKGDFVGELSSAGGSFNVDMGGNVTATSFNGIGTLAPGKIVITENNFYDYFMLSLLDINNGSALDYDGFAYNKRWIPNLKKIQNIIEFESVPQAALYDDSDNKFLIIVLPHYFEGTRNGDTAVSCRRGGLTRIEMLLLHGNMYTFATSSNFDVPIILYTTVFSDTRDFLVLYNNSTTTSATYLYNTFTNGHTRAECVFAGEYDSDLWQDIESTVTAQYENSTLPDIQNQIVECYVNLYYVLHTNNTMCFRWECSSAINIEDIGDLAIRYYYPIFENGVLVSTDNEGILGGDIVNGHISNNTVVQDTDGSYQHGYLCITQSGQNSIPNVFDLVKCRFSKTINGIKYIITI